MKGLIVRYFTFIGICGDSENEPFNEVDVPIYMLYDDFKNENVMLLADYDEKLMKSLKEKIYSSHLVHWWNITSAALFTATLCALGFPAHTQRWKIQR